MTPGRIIPQPRGPMATAAGLGFLHALVDAISAAGVYAAFAAGGAEPDAAMTVVILYNVLAFALQVPLGWAADRLGAYKAFAAGGLLLAGVTAAGAAPWPYVAAAVVGVANALFHVGAGAVVLRQSGGRAAGPGLFVAPGAVGLALGVWLGSAGFPWRWLAVALAVGGAAAVMLARLAPAARPASRPAARPLAATACVALLFASVVVRSLTAGATRQWWPTEGFAAAMTLAAIAMTGKAAGGLLADRLGWRTISVAALAVAAALLAVAAGSATSGQMPLAGAIELLVQLTMAVTLTGIYVAMPHRPGLAFGLPSAALLLGAAPAYAGYQLPGPLTAVPAVLAAAAMIFAALTILRGKDAQLRVDNRQLPIRNLQSAPCCESR